MPMMKSPFDQVVPSLFGHRLAFTANEPLHVPERCVAECMQRGVMVVEGVEPPKVVAPEEKGDNTADAEDLEDRFEAGLNQALLAIIMRNDPSDLNASMVPKVTKVVAEMSPDLRRPNATEIAKAYEVLQENIDLAE